MAGVLNFDRYPLAVLTLIISGNESRNLKPMFMAFLFVFY